MTSEEGGKMNKSKKLLIACELNFNWSALVITAAAHVLNISIIYTHMSIGIERIRNIYTTNVFFYKLHPFPTITTSLLHTKIS